MADVNAQTICVVAGADSPGIGIDSREGATLADGTTVKPRKVYKVLSQGVMIGPAPAGAPLDSLKGPVPDPDTDPAPARAGPPAGVAFVPWPSIGHMHHVVDALATRETLEPLAFRGKIKLDGTNAGVVVTAAGHTVAQSRTRLLTDGNDNAKFAAWVAKQGDYFRNALRARAATAHDGVAVVFGEWIGPGIQSRTACAKINRNVFTIFALQLGKHDAEGAPAPVLLVEPALLASIFPTHPDVFVLPWLPGVAPVLHAGDEDALKAAADAISAKVLEVEDRDPFIADTFGVDGLGEGIVFYPAAASEAANYHEISAFLFKAKGLKHQVVRGSKPAQASVQVLSSVAAFATFVCAEGRLQQGIVEASFGSATAVHTHAFVTWVVGDVRKECQLELKKNNLTFEQVSKAVEKIARDWFKVQCAASAHPETP